MRSAVWLIGKLKGKQKGIARNEWVRVRVLITLFSLISGDVPSRRRREFVLLFSLSSGNGVLGKELTKGRRTWNVCPL